MSSKNETAAKFLLGKTSSNVVVLLPRIDFHPATGENEERVSGEAGCRRCGYRVYDAEKLMAAGRVSKQRREALGRRQGE
jgi:hypothetical protein